MTDRKDDGSTIGGVLVAIACLICFAAGYWIRDQGFQFHVEQSPVERRDQNGIR